MLRTINKYLIPIIILVIAYLLMKAISASNNSNILISENDSKVQFVESQSIVNKTNEIRTEILSKVKAEREVKVVSLVNGIVIEASNKYYQGGKFQKGETLFKIDDRKYQYKIHIEKSKLATAELELLQEQGKQVVAKREWKNRNETDKQNPLSRELGLRESFIEEKKSKVQSAISNVKLALLDLEYTKVNAPCDGNIKTVESDIGDYLNTNEIAAIFSCNDKLRIYANMPQNQYQKISILDEVKSTYKTTPITIISSSNQISEKTKTIDFLLEVSGEFAKNNNFIIGQYIPVNFLLAKITNSYLIPYSALRENSTIWTVKNDEMNIINIDVLSRNNNGVIIKIKDNPGTIKVITSNIEFPYIGMKVRENIR